METTSEQDMGRFSVNVELANNADLNLLEAGHLSPDRVRRITLRGAVDTRAARLVLPESVVNRLGLKVNQNVKVRYADQRRAERGLASNVLLSYGGRSGLFDAVVEPDRDSALIGAIVLEVLDFVVDCTKQTLEPRDPAQITSEIE